MKSCRMCIIMCVQKRTSAWMSRSTRTRGGKGGHSYRNVVKSRLVCFSGRRWCSERHSTAAGRRLKTNTVLHASNSSGVHRLFCNWLDRVFQYRRWRKPIGRGERWIQREGDLFLSSLLSLFCFFSFLVGLLLKNVFLCCTTGCILKKRKREKKQRWLRQSLKQLTLAKSPRTAPGNSCTVESKNAPQSLQPQVTE